jgi:hypothetical protein
VVNDILGKLAKFWVLTELTHSLRAAGCKGVSWPRVCSSGIILGGTEKNEVNLRFLEKSAHSLISTVGSFQGQNHLKVRAFETVGCKLL